MPIKDVYFFFLLKTSGPGKIKATYYKETCIYLFHLWFLHREDVLSIKNCFHSEGTCLHKMIASLANN